LVRPVLGSMTRSALLTLIELARFFAAGFSASRSFGLPRSRSCFSTVRSSLRQALAAIWGRGGGRGNLAQGGSDSAAGLDAALAGALRAVRERSPA